MSKFLRILASHLNAVTVNDEHFVLIRVAAVRPVTGHPVTGWKF